MSSLLRNRNKKVIYGRMDRIGGGMRSILFIVFMTLSMMLNAAVTVIYSDGSYIVTQSGSTNGLQPVGVLKARPPSSKLSSILGIGAKLTPAGAIRTAVMLGAAQMLDNYEWPDIDDWPSKLLDGTGTPGAEPVNSVSEANNCNSWNPSQEGQRRVYNSHVYTFMPGYTDMTGSQYYWNAIATCIQYPIEGTYYQIYEANCQDSTCSAEQQSEGQQRLPMSATDFTDVITLHVPEIGDDIISQIPEDQLIPLMQENPTPDTSTSYEPRTVSTSIETTTINNTTGDTTTTTGTMQADWPSFCEWASIVCSFIDWMQEEPPAPPDETIPYEIVGEEQTYNSGLGSGTCPSPVPFAIQGNQVMISYQPACDAMGYFKYFAIAISTLIAAYIIVGHKQGG